MPVKQAALYLRVSTKDQTTENQRLELVRVAHAKNWQIVSVYQDEGMSGAKGRDRRPAYDQMLKDAVRAKFDVLMSWDVSRLGRSLTGLIAALDELHSQNVDLYVHQQAIDTTTPAGKAMFQMTGVFAEFERSMIRERVMAGLARAQAKGKKLGRPQVEIDQHGLRQDRLSGLSVRELAEKYRISVGKAHGLIQSSRKSSQDSM
ncbi:recombinase family protein [Mesorhizobium sp. L2C066B000]|uniref:recombinase family protein n=1 Tax=Mesorhizobium sp. L2C066B000 TaxID=1287105 RepID=UPI0003CFF770|nr:recombinase family protein [Mesorhizobium sp. L2C066B000]ESZ36376.1 resolvase [Mesorhizobium sp. L2C066B000]